MLPVDMDAIFLVVLQVVEKLKTGFRSMVRPSVAVPLLCVTVLVVAGCGGEVEVARQVPATVEVAREIPVTVEVTRSVPATVEVTREVPVEVEATREVPVTVEVTRIAPAAVSGDGGQVILESRLKVVRDRGKLICASRDDVPGWGYVDALGNHEGFDIDLCRAVAVAVLGDPDAIEIRPIRAADRGPTIQSGEVDMLVRSITWTASRDATWGNFVQTMFYDGQGFLVRKNLGISSARELKGASVCVLSRTTTELNLHEFSDKHGLDIAVLPFEWTSEALAAYERGECDAFTNDHSQLAVMSSFLNRPDAHIVLPEIVSEEPIGPVVPHGDDQWFDIVKTVMAILINGEAYDITSDAVPAAATGLRSLDRFLGYAGSFRQDSLGLSQTVAQDVLRAVGNYGEIYNRNFDARGVHIPRVGTRNALWADAPCEDCPKGGQIYAAPMR